MKRGDQIAYVPNHAKKEGLNHPDVEYGFVFSISYYNNEIIFCWYWLQGTPGQLRTVVNSEATNIRNLILYGSVSDELIQEVLKEIENTGI
ncbi:MAG: hypothetical protein KAS32_01245 [Candidatus Peribacteraceae bacterium]|nr:hypothetical protein [Candidatus Peribacteraceae bacterium]